LKITGATVISVALSGTEWWPGKLKALVLFMLTWYTYE